METMTITARGRVRVSREDRLAMDTLRVAIIGVTGGTSLNHTRFVPFPGGQLMNLFMTVLTLNLIDEMGAGIMLCRFLLVAPEAGDGLGMDFCPFFLEMFLNVSNIPVATVTRVCPMNRLGKFFLIDLTSVTLQAF